MPIYKDRVSRPPVIFHDPDAVLPYQFDWATWLERESTTISSVAWTVPVGLTNVSNSSTTTMATINISGGAVGNDYQVGCRITTVSGITDERSIILRCVER